LLFLQEQPLVFIFNKGNKLVKYLVCITGASGSIYGIRSIKALVEGGHDVHIIVSAWGEKVLKTETGRSSDSWMTELKVPPENVYESQDLMALPASGSFKPDGTIIVPCSISSIGAIAGGISLNLIHRSAEAALKEGRPLVLVPRETPLSLPALKNLCALSEAGAVILPACPAFYHAPQSMDDLINFIVGKIFDRLSIAHNLGTEWKGLT
jgi:4-hydroxy-3-polyprenylbenzoate decarboxylase